MVIKNASGFLPEAAQPESRAFRLIFPFFTSQSFILFKVNLAAFEEVLRTLKKKVEEKKEISSQSLSLCAFFSKTQDFPRWGGVPGERDPLPT